MRDALEERLASRLRTLGDTVDDEFPPPVDLERQVLRRRRNVQSKRRWSSFGIAAAIVAAATTVAVVRGTTGGGSIRIATSPTTAAPVHDSLQPGTVMLSARGRYVISLDTNGHTNATMVQTQHGDIKYARATDDHRALWYLSLKKGSDGCGDVVRADIEGRTSTIVTHALAFDVSPDGSRLALYGAGDLAHDRCSPVKGGRAGRIVVLDLTTSSSSALTVGNVTSLRWSPDGSYLVAVSCPPAGCEGFRTIDVPRELGAPLTIERGASGPAQFVHSASVVFGPHDLYTLETTTPFRIVRVDPRAARAPVLAFSGGDKWDVTQVVPTTAGTYVVAAPLKPTDAKSPKSASSGLYRIDAGRLVFVRTLDNPGTFTPVTPLAATG
ncbi:MAG: hypothetical protein M3Q30_27300 [Actinomycetota bacterium]|nr:hypothetical protein [Actinomycetota bacterium]